MKNILGPLKLTCAEGSKARDIYTESATDLDKLKLEGWFGLRLKLIFANDIAGPLMLRTSKFGKSNFRIIIFLQLLPLFSLNPYLNLTR